MAAIIFNIYLNKTSQNKNLKLTFDKYMPSKINYLEIFLKDSFALFFPLKKIKENCFVQKIK